jgi:hypothetical protein
MKQRDSSIAARTDLVVFSRELLWGIVVTITVITNVAIAIILSSIHQSLASPISSHAVASYQQLLHLFPWLTATIVWNGLVFIFASKRARWLVLTVSLYHIWVLCSCL